MTAEIDTELMDAFRIIKKHSCDYLCLAQKCIDSCLACGEKIPDIPIDEWKEDMFHIHACIPRCLEVLKNGGQYDGDIRIEALKFAHVCQEANAILFMSK
jgi:hypothetical protein